MGWEGDVGMCTKCCMSLACTRDGGMWGSMSQRRHMDEWHGLINVYACRQEVPCGLSRA